MLAEQTNGYFVLNDIFRYLAEDPEEEEEEEEQLEHNASAPATGVQEPALTAVVPEAEHVGEDAVAESEEDLSRIEHKLEQATQEEPARQVSPAPAAVNGTPVPENADIIDTEEAPATVVATNEAPAHEPEEPAVEEAQEPEKPKDTSPTPTPATSKAAPVTTPSAPSKPTAPRTWASLAASAHKVATPAVPAQTTPQAQSQPKVAPATSSQPLAIPPAQPSTPAREPSPANSQGEASGWQSVTTHKKEQPRAQNQGQAVDADQKRAYIKNVYSQVDEASLRSVMSKFGEIEYLDISRQKVYPTPFYLLTKLTRNVELCLR